MFSPSFSRRPVQGPSAVTPYLAWIVAGSSATTRYAPAGIVAAGAQLVLFSSEPYPFREEYLEDFRLRAGLNLSSDEGPALRLCRGDLVGWYPSRLPAALSHLEDVVRSYTGV